jgi:IS5 family transposase
MREMISSNPCLPFEIQTENRTVLNYQERFSKIDRLLNLNPRILRLFHKSIKSLGSEEGRSSEFSSETLLRCLLIRILEDLSLRETCIRLSHDLFLKSFVKIGFGDPPDFRLLHIIEKHLPSSVWEEINTCFFEYSRDNQLISSEQVRIDTTVTETNIHYPSDSHLLWDCFRVIVRHIRRYKDKGKLVGINFRFHNKKVKKLYTYISRHAGNKSKRELQKIRTFYVKLMDQVSRVIELAKLLEARGNGRYEDINLVKMCHFRRIAERVLHQAQQRIIEKVKVPSVEKIYSIFEEHTELIKRGKAGKDIEFGHMITLAQSKEKFITFYDCLEVREPDKNKIDKLLKDHEKKFGTLPKGLAADKGFYESMDKVNELGKNIATVSIAKKGRRTTREVKREHGKKFTALQKFRAGCEGSISVLKRAFCMHKCLLRTFKNFSARIGHIVFCHNLRLVADLIT